jgi:hypothetical protein
MFVNKGDIEEKCGKQGGKEEKRQLQFALIGYMGP